MSALRFDSVAMLKAVAARVDTINAAIIEKAIDDIEHLRAIVVKQAQQIADAEGEEHCDEGTMKHFNRYIAGDRK